VRKGIEALDFVVVQDIFMTKPPKLPMLLPATSWGEHGGVFTCADRGFQRFEQAIIATGNVKRDWEIISLLTSEMGYPMHYDNNQQIWTKCASFVRCSMASPTRKWRYEPRPVPARRWITPVRRGCIKITSSIRQPAKASCSPPRARACRDAG
jgi:anaerobic selenocysteine-containing dehydrogenase